MSYATQPIPYPARFDYGSRASYPTRAIVFHMAEGGNVAQFLSRNPARGVSVHYTIEQAGDRWRDGEVVRCLPERRISGSINPDDIRRSDDKDGVYGASYAKRALGSYWLNPNVAVVTVEVAGFAKEGPTPKQQDSMVALFEEVDERYGGVDVLVHADFADYKACPGKTAGIKAALARMGRGVAPERRRFMSTRGFAPGQVCDVREDAKLFNYPGAPTPVGNVDPPLTRSFLGWSPNGREYALISTDLQTGRTAWVRANAVANVRAGSEDCEPERAKGRVAGLDEAEAAVAAIPR